MYDTRDKTGRFIKSGPNNHYVDANGDVHIVLNHGKETIVSRQDYPIVATIRWHSQLQGVVHRQLFYAQTTAGTGSKRSIVYMHSVIMRPAPGLYVDHINGDGLDNRRDNLRIVTRRGNAQNLHIAKSSRFTGVHLYRGRWLAGIHVNGKTKYLGLFDDEVEAAAAYRSECIKLQPNVISPVPKR